MFQSQWGCWGISGSTNVLADVLAQLIAWHITYRLCYTHGVTVMDHFPTSDRFDFLSPLIGRRGSAGFEGACDMITLLFCCGSKNIQRISLHPRTNKKLRIQSQMMYFFGIISIWYQMFALLGGMGGSVIIFSVVHLTSTRIWSNLFKRMLMFTVCVLLEPAVI